MKISVQEKIAELERRIVALESQQKSRSAATTTKTTVTTTGVDLEPELGGLWASFDALFKKAFGR